MSATSKKQKVRIRANRIAMQLGDPLTDRKLVDYAKDRDRQGLPYTEVEALAMVDLTYRVAKGPPEHQFTAEEVEAEEAELGVPPELRASADEERLRLRQ